MSLDTIRGWLNEAGFDWKTGRIVYQRVGNWSGDEDSEHPGWSTNVLSTEIIKNSDPILDHEFYSGYGGPECPRFVAEDGKAFYFPSQYDGSTGIEVVYKDLTVYVRGEITPYPGG